MGNNWISLDRVDWALLNEQKLRLYELLHSDDFDIIGDRDRVDRVSSQLMGVINFLDAIIDEAAGKGLYEYEE